MYKIRLVTIMYTQKEGMDYVNIFSPAAKLVTVITILLLAPTKNNSQKDVYNTFIQWDLSEVGKFTRFLRRFGDH